MRTMKACIPLLFLMAAGCVSPAPASTATGGPAAAPTDTMAPADTAMPLRLPTDTDGPAEAPVRTIDDFEQTETVWSACVDPECTDSSAMDIAFTADHATQGQRAMQLNFTKDEKLKAVFYLEQPMDLSGGSSVSFDIFHEGTVDGVGLALTTGPDSVWHESDSVPVQRGKTVTVIFDITAGNYKTAAANWEFRSSIADLDNVVRLSIVLYPRETGCVVVDNLRWNGS
jgi:hypothetical protein